MSDDLAARLKEGPTNWGRWGESDQLGALNFLTPEEVLRGVASVREGRVFALGSHVAQPEGDLMAPGRGSNMRFTLVDNSHYGSGRQQPYANGGRFADDAVFMYTHGSTHVDALGHFWLGETLYNENPAASTGGGMGVASALPLAEHGIVGRGVLLDIPHYKERDHLDSGEEVTLADLQGAAAAQGTEIEPHDILMVRTGWLGHVSARREEHANAMEDFAEPGLRHSEELVDWFHHAEITLLGCDNFTNECWRTTAEQETLALHVALMSRLGILFSEINWLDDLAAACRADGRYEFCYVGSPLKIIAASGSPMNPVAIR